MENATSSTRKDKTASDALRVNLVFSERRETEMYGDLMNAGVGDRGAILKYWVGLSRISSRQRSVKARRRHHQAGKAC